MTPQHFSDAVLAALGGLVRRGAFALSGELPASVVVERPQLAGQGDYSTNAALQLAGRAGLSSRELAELLAQELRPVAGVASASTAGPGFVNVTVTWAALQAVAEQVVDAGSAYGAVDVGLGTLLADPATRLVDRVGVDDPLHAVRYAHSRLASLLRNATDLGVGTGAAGPALLDHPCERELLLVVAEYPTVVAIAARLREPHRVARHLEDTVAAFHRFSDSCRVLPQGDEDPTELHRARLLLVDATRTVVANGLHLLGANAPARM